MAGMYSWRITRSKYSNEMGGGRHGIPRCHGHSRSDRNGCHHGEPTYATRARWRRL